MSRLASLLENRFLLMVSLPQNRVDLARAAARGGADTIKVHANVSHFASGTHFGSFAEEKAVYQEILTSVSLPVGLVPGGEEAMCSLDEMQEAQRMGFDFWDVFWHHAPLYLYDVQGMGRMMAMDSTFTADRVRYVSQTIDLVEGSVIPQTGYRSSLKAMDLGTYHTLCQAASCPVAIPTQRAIRPEEVRHLRQAGARGVVIGAVVTGHDPQELEATTRRFRQSIDSF